MLSHIFKTYCKILKTAGREFGTLTLLRWLCTEPLLLLFNHSTLFLDNVFFPGYRKVKVQSPIFIIGHPRSGTTFLHRLLTSTNEFAVFKLWELIIPAISGRILFWPTLKIAELLKRDVILPPTAGHQARLGDIEEEELLFLHNFDTQFVGLFTPLAFAEDKFANLCFNDEQPHRHQSVVFFKRCLQRHIYSRPQKQIVAKLNYSGMRVKTLLDHFPDAKFIFVWRPPQETIHSHLSLHSKIFAHKWGSKKISPATMEKYFAMRYEYNVVFYKYLYDLATQNHIPQQQLLQVPYSRLRFNLQQTMDKIIEFSEIEASDQLRKTIEAQDARQVDYKPQHKNLSLAEFGLTEEQIQRDLGFVGAHIEELEKSY